MSNDFRNLERPKDGSRACQLFRASASAFGSLSRPTKAEIQQFEELSLALYEKVPEGARRHAAVMIATNGFAPRALVLKLANEPAAVSAPLLANSPILLARDIPPLIARHGVMHARILAQRSDLEPALRALLAVFVRNNGDEADTDDAMRPAAAPAAAPAANVVKTPERAPAPLSNVPAEDVRSALRGAMAANSGRPELPVTTARPALAPEARLQPTALSGNPVFFQTALADALELPFQKVGDILSQDRQANLIMALRSIPLPAEKAFVIAAALWPQRFASPQAIARFLQRYKLTAIDAARDRVARWREDLAEDTQEDRFTGHVKEPARNDDGFQVRLRAS